MRRNEIIVAVALLALCVGPVAASDGGAEYDVTVTNLTAGQVFTPILVATHRPDVRPFVAGQPASVELEMLAEGGDTGPLAAVLRTLPQVEDVTDSGAPVPPGQSVTVRVHTRGRADHVSLLAMLVRPARLSWMRLRDVRHRGRDRELVAAIDLGQPTSRIAVEHERFDRHAGDGHLGKLGLAHASLPRG